MYAFTDADRQDLFQEIVIQLWTAYPRYRGTARFSTWLYRVAINTAITRLRRKKVVVETYNSEAFPEQLASYQPGDTEEEQLQLLYAAIERLNEVEKAIVMLYMEDKSYEEMEDILGIGQGNLRVKMSRIKDKLRTLTKNN
jgi:RNA polymerase sigma-70 factor (ECF subfamily)